MPCESGKYGSIRRTCVRLRQNRSLMQVTRVSGLVRRADAKLKAMSRLARIAEGPLHQQNVIPFPTSLGFAHRVLPSGFHRSDFGSGL